MTDSSTIPTSSHLHIPKGFRHLIHHDVLLRLLTELAKEPFTRTRQVQAAEIGVADGRTAEWLMANVPSLHHTMVDIWGGGSDARKKRMMETYEVVLERTDPFKDRRRVIKSPSLDAAFEVDNESLDLAFIDANHRHPYVLSDCAAWWPKVRSGGILCGHDWQAPKNKSIWGVQRAVEQFKLLMNVKYEVQGTCWVIYKD